MRVHCGILLFPPTFLPKGNGHFTPYFAKKSPAAHPERPLSPPPLMRSAASLCQTPRPPPPLTLSLLSAAAVRRRRRRRMRTGFGGVFGGGERGGIGVGEGGGGEGDGGGNGDKSGPRLSPATRSCHPMKDEPAAQWPPAGIWIEAEASTIPQDRAHCTCHNAVTAQCSARSKCAGSEQRCAPNETNPHDK